MRIREMIPSRLSLERDADAVLFRPCQTEIRKVQSGVELWTWENMLGYIFKTSEI